jgi:hypothetical protein
VDEQGQNHANLMPTEPAQIFGTRLAAFAPAGIAHPRNGAWMLLANQLKSTISPLSLFTKKNTKLIILLQNAKEPNPAYAFIPAV